MRIFIDIGHPAHVHYFKNFIKLMQRKNHEFFITARKKEVAFDLLDHYGIKFHSRGLGGDRALAKFFYIFKADKLLYQLSKKFNPHIFLSFGSSYAAHAAKLLGKPHIAFDDTEHARLEHLMYVPFTDVILTPSSFLKDFGKKHIRFDGCMELCSLHPSYFEPDESILGTLGVQRDEPYVIMRFISWRASHDIGYKRLNLDTKLRLCHELSKYARIFISSESGSPHGLEKYQIRIPPEKLHDALSFAALYIGEGGTTANECAVLGVPNILVNSILTPKTTPGLHYELQRLGLQFLFDSPEGITAKAIEILRDPDIKKAFYERKQKMLSEKIDVVAFMVWFVENYPASLQIMKQNPAYQDNFKGREPQ
jgi:predicted glycosyltransferase